MSKPRPSSLAPERLKELIRYDPGTGLFFRRPRLGKGGTRKERPTGSLINTGYLTIQVDGFPYVAHRLAWLYVHGDWPPYYLDHANGNKTDNRICNLRKATQQQNMANQHVLRNDNKSGYRGVSYRKDSHKWRAVIKIGATTYHLGSYSTPEEAKAIYDSELKRHFGEFAHIIN